ncbi:hypothetical protein FB381_3231 [Nocardioides albertanoniae]|uniref:Uncharacterized protein n=1 Tax=Nocardioides albertanoniae TaxID=1175486 RepID=A0A543AA37_9ACTN|nr:hypothetical protein [Nocardioides albertanoniae]TQL69326.1 hypothetical protein FB381_3231 [Nocardioides albertanoniae]
MTATDAEANVAPEVRLFLAQVRRELVDLDPEALSDITDGLEADFGELVEERGPEALGDPVEYARELRAAAGIPVRTKAPRGLGARVDGLLDAGHARFDTVVARSGELLRTDLRPAVAWLRPLWWFVRAWAVAWAVNEPLGWTMGDALGLVTLVVAVAVSMLIGIGRIWPGGERGTRARVGLLVLNLAAVLLLFVAWASSEIGGSEYDRGWSDGYSEAGGVATDGAPVAEGAGTYSDGRWVTNIYPYDASGKPLTGVQLFDQDGKPIDLAAQPDCGSADTEPLPPTVPSEDGASEVCLDENTGEPVQTRVVYPWANGEAELYNVFPLPSRMQAGTKVDPNAFETDNAPAIQDPPLETAPKASLPEAEAGSPGASPSASPSASPGAAENP